tara:strand:+ start:470 stop:1441 length:972 start_codon:yes stop_codon:yes gene_type:complete
MVYDIIYVGGSLCNLIHPIELSGSILIIEKENYLGGAWNVDSYKNVNIESGIHLIVPPDNTYYEKFNNYLSKFDIQLEKISENDFFYETKTFASYGKEGDSLICNKGWGYFFNQIKHHIEFKNNIKINKNETIKNININELCTIKTDKNTYYTKKVIIPVYSNLNKITYFDKILDMYYENITNLHLLIEIDNLNNSLTSKFQGFYDKEPIGMYDRISIASMKNEILLLGRISKNYKSKYFNITSIDELYNDTKKFLLEKKLIDEKTIILNLIEKKYYCAYRCPEIREDIIHMFNKLDTNKVEFLQTHYMGHFLANYCDNLKYY